MTTSTNKPINPSINPNDINDSNNKDANETKPSFRPMARIKQSLGEEEISRVLDKETRGVLCVHGENGYPYGIPMNFWYDKLTGCIYFHSGKKGHKVDAIRANSKACFCVYDAGYRRENEWALNVSSVIIFGQISPLEDEDRATEIYHKLSHKFTSDDAYIESEISKFAKSTLCYELIPEHVSGKLVNEA